MRSFASVKDTVPVCHHSAIVSSEFDLEKSGVDGVEDNVDSWINPCPIDKTMAYFRAEMFKVVVMGSGGVRSQGIGSLA